MSIQFQKIWIEQCEATEGIRDRFGLEDALNYLIGEKLFHFVQAAEQHPEFAAELPAFVAEIQRLFTAGQIHDYLDDLEKRKYLAPREPNPVLDDLDEQDDEEIWLENPVMGAEELLRFFRIRQLLQQTDPRKPFVRRHHPFRKANSGIYARLPKAHIDSQL